MAFLAQMGRAEMTAQWAMMLIVVIGLVLNGLMLKVAIRRKFRVDSRVSEDIDTRRQVAKYTLRRTVRLETGFFACQLARFMHTCYVMHVHQHVDWQALTERTFVTAVLVVLSVADVFTRNKIAKLLSLMRDDQGRLCLPCEDL